MNLQTGSPGTDSSLPPLAVRSPAEGAALLQLGCHSKTRVCHLHALQRERKQAGVHDWMASELAPPLKKGRWVDMATAIQDRNDIESISGAENGMSMTSARQGWWRFSFFARTLRPAPVFVWLRWGGYPQAGRKALVCTNDWAAASVAAAAVASGQAASLHAGPCRAWADAVSNVYFCTAHVWLVLHMVKNVQGQKTPVWRGCTCASERVGSNLGHL